MEAYRGCVINNFLTGASFKVGSEIKIKFEPVKDKPWRSVSSKYKVTITMLLEEFYD